MRMSARLAVRELSNEDRQIYDRVVPEDSLLRAALELIDWKAFEPELKKRYKRSEAGPSDTVGQAGQPPYPPLILFKMEFLRYLYGLSNRQLVRRCQTDLELKYFLQLPVEAILPDQSTCTCFRKRIGVECFQKLFDLLVAQAREHGLVKDKLRLKDATHVLADIAIPTTLHLLAQLRDRMLSAVKLFDPKAAESFRIDMEVIRKESDNDNVQSKLEKRLGLVEDILQWIIECPRPDDAAENKDWRKLQAVRELAEKIFGDVVNQSGGGKTLSVADPDARRGKHGDFYEGYLLDVMMDADSEIITGLDLLPANANEAGNAASLIEHEEQVHGNDIEQLSIDGIGFNGEVLRTLSDPEGLDVDVTTPPRDFNTSKGFESEEFEVIDDGERVKCPAGEVSRKASVKKNKPNTKFYTFAAGKCAACPLLAQCHPNMKPGSKTGRQVSKNEYEKEYAAARAKATTPEYAEVRRRHPAIERKLNELVRHHRARRAVFRGQARVKIQQLMTGLVVNVKRMVKLMGIPRAELQLSAI